MEKGMTESKPMGVATRVIEFPKHWEKRSTALDVILMERVGE
jgi:hypothetical protein